MNYQKIHDSIIDRAKIRNLTNRKETYFERHHIIPKCLGGSNCKENLVNLTAREHFLIHWLLIRIYPENDKLISSFFILSTRQNYKKINLKISSRSYEESRIAFSISHSKFLTGKKRKNYKKQIRGSCIYCKNEFGLRSLLLFHGDNCKLNPNISQKQLDKRKHKNKHSKEICIYCKQEHSIGILKVHHNDNCKHNPNLTLEKKNKKEINSKKISIRQKNNKKQCSHCLRFFDSRNYYKWHGEMCKYNPNISIESLSKWRECSKRTAEKNINRKLIKTIAA